MNLDNCRVIVFAKAPVPGQVKSRLIPSLGALGAAALYERMALHCLATAVRAEVGPVDLWCMPSTEHPFFRRCAEEFDLSRYAQLDGDLGRRMGYAFEETLKRSRLALLIGTDCPSLSSDDLREAAVVLQGGVDAAISPSADGGYVMIGLRHYTPELFLGVSWGTQRVMEETRFRLRGLGWRWQELSERWDVDRIEDVERLRHEGFAAMVSSLSVSP